MLEKIQVRKKCWFCEILKSRNFKVCTHKGIGKMLEKNTSQRKSVDFVKSKNLEKCWICVFLK